MTNEKTTDDKTPGATPHERDRKVAEATAAHVKKLEREENEDDSEA